jgi:hypothetical protein
MRCTIISGTRSCCALFHTCGLVVLAISVCLCIPLSAMGQAKPVQDLPTIAIVAPKSPDIAKEGLVLEKVYM